MHILYTSNLYPPAIGGSQILMHSLAKAISGMGCRVSAITLTSRYRTDWLRLSTIATEGQRNYTYEGIPVSQIGFSRRTRLLLLPWALAYYAFMKPAVRAISRHMLPFFEDLPCCPSLVHATRNGREFLARASLISRISTGSRLP